MIFVSLNRSWPEVLAGEDTAERVTLESWALVSDQAIETYGDTICGVYQGTVVTALDITGHTRVEDGHRVAFHGVPSKEWASLVNEASPVVWTQGQARPVRYLSTSALRDGTVPVEESDAGLRRAVLGDYTLTVSKEGVATVLIPVGGAVTVVSRQAV